MAKSDRLFRLLAALRLLPQPVTASRLAEETGVSLRTLYRDIEALRAGGALIDGAAGLGYTLTEDPRPGRRRCSPGSRSRRWFWVWPRCGWRAIRRWPGRRKARLAKITATLPERVQRQALHAVSQTYRHERRPARARASGEGPRSLLGRRGADDLLYRQ